MHMAAMNVWLDKGVQVDGELTLCSLLYAIAYSYTLGCNAVLLIALEHSLSIL